MKKAPLLIVMSAACVFAGPASKEMRSHYLITDRSHQPLYYVTTVSTLGDRLAVQVRRDFRSHETRATYTLNAKQSVDVRMQLPFISAKTRQETSRENKEHRNELRAKDVPVTIESNGQSVQTTERTWHRGDADSKNHHARVKAVVDPRLAAAVTKLIPAFAFPDLSAACSSLSFVTDRSGCVGDTAYLIAPISPDCSFDAEFDLPCSAEHAANAKALRASHRDGTY
jgi:hypothetical protein